MCFFLPVASNRSFKFDQRGRADRDLGAVFRYILLTEHVARIPIVDVQPENRTSCTLPATDQFAVEDRRRDLPIANHLQSWMCGDEEIKQLAPGLLCELRQFTMLISADVCPME